MQIRNVTEDQIQDAMDLTNEEFDNNIKFKSFDQDGQTRASLPKFNATLTVKDSSKAGGRRARSGRRVAAACWHAHGTFMDSLPDEAEIVVNWSAGRLTIKPGDPWTDMNIGGPYRPFYYSDACEC